MRKKKSSYTLQFKCGSNSVNQIMQSYLSANNFIVFERKGERYFRAGDNVLGHRGLTYFISNQTITIEAWLDGTLGKFPLEQSSLNMMAMNYRNSLSTLFQEIENLNGGNFMNNNVNQNQINYDSQTGQPINQNINQANYNNQPIQSNQNQINYSNQNQFSQTFKNENEKKQETMCEIGFWLSIFGLVCSFFGMMMGFLVYVMDFYFASQGLKTRKRGKAIATIVLSIISIIIIIVELFVIAQGQ